MTRTVAATILALTLLLSVGAQAQPEQHDMSGTWQITAKYTDAAGAFLDLGSHYQLPPYESVEVVASVNVPSSTQITRVGETERYNLYHIQQGDYYLTVRDGKVSVQKGAPAEEADRWVIWENSNGYSIMSWDDGGTGANALGFISKDHGKTIVGPDQDELYPLELARNNAEGKGNLHQLWELKKE